MKLIMTLLVRDESDIIRENLDYHLDRGVDFFVVTDNGSIDGTREIIQEYVDRRVAEVIDEPEQNFNQAEWVTRMARRAYTEHRADWIINADADEFWWPFAENLKTALNLVPLEYGALSVPMLHFVPVGINKGSVNKMTLRFRSKDRMKTCHRGYPDIVVGFGNHRIQEPEVTVFPGKAPLTIFHFPERSFEQFEKKIKNGGKALTNNLVIPGNLGTHWRERYNDFVEGRLWHTWEKRIQYSWFRALKGLLLRKFVFDKRLARYFKKRSSVNSRL